MRMNKKLSALLPHSIAVSTKSHTLLKIAVFFFVCSCTHGFLCVCSYAPGRPQFYIVVCGGSEQCWVRVNAMSNYHPWHQLYHPHSLSPSLFIFQKSATSAFDLGNSFSVWKMKYAQLLTLCSKLTISEDNILYLYVWLIWLLKSLEAHIAKISFLYHRLIEWVMATLYYSACVLYIFVLSIYNYNAINCSNKDNN